MSEDATMKQSECHQEGLVVMTALLSAGLVVGCRGGGERPGAASNTTRPAPPAAESSRPTGGEAAPASITPTMIATGDSIFHGKLAGGTRFTCHGPEAKGTPTGPNLADADWLDSDGSYKSLVTIVTNGVPTPKKYPAPMPPMGGASLSPEQVRAVAAYEYSLSHPKQ